MLCKNPPARSGRSRSPSRDREFAARRKLLEVAECSLLLRPKPPALLAADVSLPRLISLNESTKPLGALLKSIWALGLFGETATLRRVVEATSLYHMLTALGDACLASDTQKNGWSWLRANDLWVLLTA